MKALRALGALCLSSVGLIACSDGVDGTSGSPDDPGAIASPGAPGGPGTTPTGSDTGTSTNGGGSIAINKAIYVAGTKIDISTATLADGVVRFESRITNENVTDNATYEQLSYAPVILEIGDQRVDISPNERPITPVGSSSPVHWRGNVKGIANLSMGHLIFGKTTENRSILPLGSGPVTTFVPKVGFGIGRSITTPVVKIEIVQSQLRATYGYDLKDQYTLLLKVRGSGLAAVAGAWNFQASSFTLVEPGGNAVASSFNSNSDAPPLNEILDKDVMKDGWVPFTVEKTRGEFTLRFSRMGSGASEGELKFTIQ